MKQEVLHQLIHIMDDIYCDIGVHDWPKRRRAILTLLDNPRLPPYAMGSVRDMAHWLADKLETNAHPMCAYAIRLRLSGVRVRLEGSKVVVIETVADNA